MAFNAGYMTRIGGNANFNTYTYTTADTQDTVIASGYFDSMINDLNVGDIILLVFDTGGTIGTSELIVTSVTSAVTTTDNVTQT
jgi:hypothetical protein